MTDTDARIQALEQRVAEVEADIARRDEFISLIAHEIRTPLAAVVGWADLLRAMPPTSERIEHAAGAIERATLVQVRLLDDLVVGTKLSVGALALNRGPVLIAETTADAAETLRPIALETRVKIVVEPSDGGTVFGDAVRLQQAITNVIAAALRVASQPGQIDVDVDRDDVHAEIRVYCSSRPEVPTSEIDQAQRDQVLESDLGLKIANELFELHGGSCHVSTADTPDRCVFNISLPLLPVGFDEHSGPPPSDDPVACAGLRILVVDDEPEARSLIAEVLSRRGARVDIAASTTDALDALREKKYDVLVSDLTMPLEDGFSLLEQVRRGKGPNHSIPAIALTARASADTRDRVVTSGFAAYVTKPVSSAALVNVVATVARTPAGT